MMRSATWLRLLALTAVLANACGSVQHAQSSLSTPSQNVYPSPTTASSSRLQCPAGQTRFSPSGPSSRNLALVGLRGGDPFVVRDITDINHPFTVSSLGSLVDYRARFVNASELSDSNGNLGLVRMPLSGLPKTVVAGCGDGLFAWSPDGTAAAYLTGSIDSGTNELHIVSGGRDVVVTSMPSPFQGGVGCDSRSCSENWFFHIDYSPNGSYFSLVEQPGPGLRIWTSSGRLIKSIDSISTTMAVWSGNSLYWRDDKGVEMWHDGSQSLVLPGVSWIRPHASPAGGQIVYETREPGYGTAHISVLDTTTGSAREITQSRSEPSFLTSRYVWYLGEYACGTTRTGYCASSSTAPTGITYIFDLQSGIESQSIITDVWDVWPHPA
jgi:hypothetical protein